MGEIGRAVLVLSSWAKPPALQALMAADAVPLLTTLLHSPSPAVQLQACLGFGLGLGLGLGLGFRVRVRV